MKTIFALALTFTLGLLTSCSNDKDYVYNEVMASKFYRTKESVEELHKSFIDGKFDQKDTGEMDFKIKSISNNQKNAKETLETIKTDMQPTEIAKDFHQANLDYYDLIINKYTVELEKYYNEPEYNKKMELKTNVNTLFSQIENQENLMLEKQIKFFDKAGIKGVMPE